MRILAFILILGFACSTGARAQEVIDPRTYGSGAGFQILLSNSGFGLGGYYSRSVTTSTSLLLDLSIGSGKDEREARFFRFGSSFVPGKANYLLMMPIQGGASMRLFREEIEDNFRPYIQLTAGPTLGWQYPYFNDCNGNGNLDDAADCNGDGVIDPDEGEYTYGFFEAIPKGDLRLGAGATIAVGAYFGQSRRATQGIRIGYTLHYFFDGVQLMERRIEDVPRKFIGSPTITLTFGRLFSRDATR